MCARITLTTTPEEVADLFGLADDIGAGFTPAYNVAPSRQLPVVRLVGGVPELAWLRWGLVPNWSRRPQGYPTARAEGVASRRAFRGAVRARRCIVPVGGFFEWEAVGRAKQPYFFRRAGGGALAVAGLWDRWAGGAAETVALVTVPANDLVGRFHGRMPAVLEAGQFGTWLGGKFSDALALLKPCPAGVLEAWPVSREVNSVKAEGAGLLRPVKLPRRNRQPSLFDEAA